MTYQGAPPRCLLSSTPCIVPSSVSVTSAEVIKVRIGPSGSPYVLFFIWLLCSGPGKFSVDCWLAGKVLG